MEVMLGILVPLFSTRRRQSKYLFRFLFRLITIRSKILKKNLVFDSKRFMDASWVTGSLEPLSGTHEKTIELVFVSTRKDFDILVNSLSFAVKALSQYQISQIRIIVPANDFNDCAQLFLDSALPIRVIDETTLVSNLQFQLLTKTFSNRNTWVLQQLLKVQAVRTSKSESVLILDSDTILLRPRPWFDNTGKQILMPSYEFNPYYYDFLHTLGLSNRIPEHTFISHHMLMQPDIFNRILREIHLENFEDFINYCCTKADISVQSPLCIEYELYGQYLNNNLPESRFLSRWSNITVSKRFAPMILRSKLILRVLTFFYNSVSFHSWS